MTTLFHFIPFNQNSTDLCTAALYYNAAGTQIQWFQ